MKKGMILEQPGMPFYLDRSHRRSKKIEWSQGNNCILRKFIIKKQFCLPAEGGRAPALRFAGSANFA